MSKEFLAICEEQGLEALINEVSGTLHSQVEFRAKIAKAIKSGQLTSLTLNLTNTTVPYFSMKELLIASAAQAQLYEQSSLQAVLFGDIKQHYPGIANGNPLYDLPKVSYIINSVSKERDGDMMTVDGRHRILAMWVLLLASLKTTNLTWTKQVNRVAELKMPCLLFEMTPEEQTRAVFLSSKGRVHRRTEVLSLSAAIGKKGREAPINFEAAINRASAKDINTVNFSSSMAYAALHYLRGIKQSTSLVHYRDQRPIGETDIAEAIRISVQRLLTVREYSNFGLLANTRTWKRENFERFAQILGDQLILAVGDDTSSDLDTAAGRTFQAKLVSSLTARIAVILQEAYDAQIKADQ